MNRPEINVTPLIDVLLVLLIIFMVVTPTKLSSFKAKIPAEPNRQHQPALPNPDTLVVTVGVDDRLSLNKESGLGTVDQPEMLIERLRDVFAKRQENYADPGSEPRYVFIKAPKQMGYGKIAKAVDSVKMSGAEPIALLIDELN